MAGANWLNTDKTYPDSWSQWLPNTAIFWFGHKQCYKNWSQYISWELHRFINIPLRQMCLMIHPLRRNSCQKTVCSKSCSHNNLTLFPYHLNSLYSKVLWSYCEYKFHVHAMFQQSSTMWTLNFLYSTMVSIAKC